jgi:hypothetical protein
MADIVAVTLLTFRDMIRKISPPWLATGNNEAVLYSGHAMIDATGAATQAGVLSRFPGLVDYQTLPYIGKERRIRRGIYEDDATYANRLRSWLSDHPYRGGPYAMLQQLYLHYSPFGFPIQLIYRTGKRYTLDPLTGEVTTDLIAWSPDGTPTRWAQWWLVFTTDIFTFPLDEDGTNDIKAIPIEWNAAHAVGHLAIMQSSAEFWSTPSPSTWDSPAPELWDSAIGPVYIDLV